MDMLKKKMKSADRILWVEYGVSVDKESLVHSLIKYEGFDGLVFPVVKEGIDWDLFKKKCQEKCQEPSHQMGLAFDTEVSKKIINKEKDFYEVEKTDPFCWVLDCKRVWKKLQDKKNKFVYPPSTKEFFEKCLAKKVKLVAAAGAKTYNHYTHECVGNIMNIPGLVVT